MKRAILAEDGETIENVILIDENTPPAEEGTAIDLVDEAPIGPGEVLDRARAQSLVDAGYMPEAEFLAAFGKDD